MVLLTYDLPEVRQFVEELKAKRSGCFDGQYCSKLDELIACQFEVCKELNEAIATWKQRVFLGHIECDPNVEIALREQVEQTLETAQQVVNIAQDREAECFEFARLNLLEKQARTLYRHQVKWVSPRRAVRPGYRQSLTPAQIATMRSGLAAIQRK